MIKEYIIIGALSIIVGVTLIYGFVAAGGPGAARKQKLDETRVQNLQNVKNLIDNYYADNKVLPENLDELKTSASGFSGDGDFFADPETKERYVYETTGSRNYQLCATFSAKSTSHQEAYYGSGEFKHDSGYQCFNLKVISYD